MYTTLQPYLLKNQEVGVMHTVCPGAKLIRQPMPEMFDCPKCGAEVEIWTDELRGTCGRCKTVVLRYQDQSCLEWCKLATTCVGQEAYDNFMQNRTQMMKDKLIHDVELLFGDDQRRINHAKKVMKYVREILKEEEGDWHILMPASILHDVGIKVAEEKYGSAAGHLQEKEGPGVARKLLLKLGMRMEDIEEICEIIAHHHSPGIIKTKNFEILYDADLLVNIEEEMDTKDESKLRRIIEKSFLTPTGRTLAEKTYLSS
jgi:HD superfamily phosphodiesterase